MKHERSCVICGTKYSYCPNCSAYNHLPRWMFSFHDENCKNVWMAINDYRTGAKTADQAKAALEKCDLSNRENFDKGFKVFVDQIFSEATPKFNVEKRDVKKNNSESKFNYNKK